MTAFTKLFHGLSCAGNMHWTHVVDRASCASGQTIWFGDYQTCCTQREAQQENDPWSQMISRVHVSARSASADVAQVLIHRAFQGRICLIG